LSTIDRIREIVEPLLADRDLTLYDVEQRGPVVRVTVETPDGVDLDDLGSLTRAVSLALDEHDPIPGRYTLEVSSPGLERPLRTVRHYQQAIGTQVSVKTRFEVDGQRRFIGTLVAADDHAIDVQVDESTAAPVHLLLDDIAKARTVFEWGPPSSGQGSAAKQAGPAEKTKTKKKKTTTTAKAASS
jgi:ribosome maturation factor RimP